MLIENAAERDEAARSPVVPALSKVPALLTIGLALIGLVAVAAWYATASRFEAFTLTAFAHGAFYLAAVVLIVTGRARPRDLLLIIAVAVVMRMIAVTVPPTLTTDAFRYVWDGRIQWAGFNPYMHVPADPALAHLRDTAIYPNVHKKDVAVTIYPPFAEIVFLIANRLYDGLAGVKVVMVAFEVVIAWVLVRWLTLSGLPRERVLIYAWHPLPIWEFASMAHIDAAATALLMLTLLAALQRRQGLAGVLLAAAVLTKYFPLAVLPAIWRRWDWRLPAAFIATAVVLYLPYVIGAGPNVLGFLGAHLDSEGYRAGYGFHVIWMLRDFSIADPPGIAWVAIALVILAGIGLVAFVARSREEIVPAHLVLIAAAFVWLTSPHYPWYFGWIVPLLAIHMSPAAMAMTLLCLVQNIPATSPALKTMTHAIVFGGPLLVGLAAYTLERRRVLSGAL